MDDGFINVHNNKQKSKQSIKPDTSDNQAACQQPNPVPAQETYRLFFPKDVSPRDGAIWLAAVTNKPHNLSVQPRMTVKSIIAVTRDMGTVKFLTEIGHPYQNTDKKLTSITEDNKQTKVTIRNYPSYMPLDYIEDLSSALWVERERRRDNRAPRNLVLALWKGESPLTL